MPWGEPLKRLNHVAVTVQEPHQEELLPHEQAGATWIWGFSPPHLHGAYQCFPDSKGLSLRDSGCRTRYH